MRDVFALFYAVLFGSLLSAEIGTYAQFNLQASKSIWEWTCRVALLLVGRAMFFAWAYVSLPATFSPSRFTAFVQVIVLLGLCVPVIGFQHLSYLIVRPQYFQKVPSILGPKTTAGWWIVSAATVLVVAGFLVWTIMY